MEQASGGCYSEKGWHIIYNLIIYKLIAKQGKLVSYLSYDSAEFLHCLHVYIIYEHVYVFNAYVYIMYMHAHAYNVSVHMTCMCIVYIIHILCVYIYTVYIIHMHMCIYNNMSIVCLLLIMELLLYSPV